MGHGVQAESMFAISHDLPALPREMLMRLATEFSQLNPIPPIADAVRH